MSNAWFFEKFELIADLPDAVSRMRELVLELSVQGRFSQPTCFDALKQNAETKNCTEFNLPATSLQFPSPWGFVALKATLSELKNGYSGQAKKSSGLYKITRIETIADGTFDLERVGFADDIPEPAIEKHRIQFGDILLSHINSIPHIGKTAIYTGETGALIHGVNLLLLRVNSRIDPFYLNIVLRRIRASGYFKTIAKQAINQASINQKTLGELPIPLPPLSEQRRIVAKVEELMGICDRLELEQRERESSQRVLVRSSLQRFSEEASVENLGYLFHRSYTVSPSDLRKTILTLAVQGKLVPQDPEEESAEELMKRVELMRDEFFKENKLTDLTTKIRMDRHNCFDEIPKGWIRVTLSELGGFAGGGTPSKSRPEFWKGNIPWVSPKDMKRPYLDSTIDNISERAVESSSCKLIPSGSLLMVVRGMILIHSFPVALTQRPLTINQDMKALVPVISEIGEYLLRCCAAITSRVINLVERSSHGTCRLSIDEIANLHIPLPPLAEQRRIVAKVEELMSMVDELEEMEKQATAHGSSLLDAIVHELAATAG